jgi:hypothetical protein
MALFGGSRDISLFRKINRELMGNIITQQCAYYKFQMEDTVTNIYGEASGGKYYIGPTLLNALISRGDQSYVNTDMGLDIEWPIEFRFLRDDFVDASILPEVGDVIMYYESYYEVNQVNTNQYFVGKDTDHPYSENPINPGLENFGYNVSVVCKTHLIPADLVNITKERG